MKLSLETLKKQENTNMKNNIFISTLLMLFTLLGVVIKGQCPSASGVTLSVAGSTTSCSTNGTITATFSPSGSSSNITVQLLKNGAVQKSDVNVSSPHTFSNLQAGNDYSVRLICSTDNSVVIKTATVTVDDGYNEITDVAVSTTNVCSNFTQGGTINIDGVTGGKAPLQYSIIQNASANYPDNLSNYSASTSKTVTAFGTYQIRVKDACGEYYTKTFELAPSLPKVDFKWKPTRICGSGNQVKGSYWYMSNSSVGGVATILDHPNGINIEIRDTNASGAILYSGHIASENSVFTYTMNSSHVYYITTTNACGLSSTSIHDLSINTTDNGERYDFRPVVKASGCGSSETMSVSGNLIEQSFWQYPVTAVLKNTAGTQIGTSQTLTGPYDATNSYNFTGLPMGNYDLTLTDACGGTKTIRINNVRNAGAPVMKKKLTLKWLCGDNGLPPLTQNNTTQVQLEIEGYFPDLNNADVKIISGPSNVGVKGILINGSLWTWSNMLPGTYVVQYSSCGQSYTYTFVIDSNDDLLHQSFTATANSQCGGTGNITSTLRYDGSYTYIVELVNSAGTVIQTSQTGNFSNIPAGQYTVRMKVTPYCGNNGEYNYYVDQPVKVTIVGANGGAQVSSNVGIICEDGSGNALSTGSAYLDIAGAGPFTVDYSTSPTGPWTTINGVGNFLTLNNLVANTEYYVEITDICGIKRTHTVQVNKMGSLSTTNSVHPCNNQPYTLEIPYYSGATYEWVNPQGAVISNTRTYSIPSYDPSYNGTYVAKITWGNCVTRYVNLTINSSQCGEPIQEACYRDAGTLSPILDSKHGITTLGRAGTANGNWPMVRKGAHTVLESKTKGFVVNRLTTADKNKLTPVLGMTVYDVDLDCLSIYDGSAWKCYRRPGCPD